MKKATILALAFASLALLAVATYAQTTLDAPIVPGATVAQDAVSDAIAKLALKAPWISTVLLVMGACRVLIKPLFTFLHAVVQVTPSRRDDDLLAKAESSTWFRWLNWVLDYVFSIKLIHPQTTAPVQLLVQQK